MIWAGHNILLDGHNRYAIAQKHGLKFKTVEIKLPGRDDVKRWIFNNQLGRRNLSPQQASYIRGKLYEMGKQSHGGQTPKGSCQNGNSLKTEEVIAEGTGVSPRTIHRDADFAQAIDTIEQVVGEKKRDAILNRNIKMTKKDIKSVARLATEAPELVDDVLSGKKTVKQINEEREREARPKPIVSTGLQPRIIVGFAENMYTVDNESIDLIIAHPLRSGEDWQIDCLNEMYRVAKQGASLFYRCATRQEGSEFFYSLDWLRDPRNPWTMRQEIILDYRKAQGERVEGLCQCSDERVCWMTKSKAPTLLDKPTKILTIWDESLFADQCLKLLGREGMVVLDPFMNSDKTVITSLSMEYDTIGVCSDSEQLDAMTEKRGWVCQVEKREVTALCKQSNFDKRETRVA